MKLLFIVLFLGSTYSVKAQSEMSQDSIHYYVDETRNILSKILKDQNLSPDFKNNNTIDPKYINDNISNFKKVLDNSDKLIKNNPNRIDYFTTKTYLYFISNMYDNFINESETLLIQAKINNNNWYNLSDTNKTEEDILLKVYYP